MRGSLALLNYSNSNKRGYLMTNFKPSNQAGRITRVITGKHCRSRRGRETGHVRPAIGHFLPPQGVSQLLTSTFSER